MTSSTKPRWAPKVPQQKIRRLYDLDARGIVDETLIDDVGIGLYLRCRSILAVSEIGAKCRLPCPDCEEFVGLEKLAEAGNAPDFVVCCSCGWEMAWGSYWATYRHNELGKGGAGPIFREFVQNWDGAQTSRERLLLIDRLIHLWHWQEAEVKPKFGYGRPTGVNLIEGNRKEVIAFLESLTYGDGSMAGTQTQKAEWRAIRQQIQGNEAQWRTQRKQGQQDQKTGD